MTATPTFISLVIFGCLFNFNLHSQESSNSTSELTTANYLDQLFQSGQKFEDIVKEADDYFKSKYPDLTAVDLSKGEFRDGDYIKYQRWQAFWKNFLNEDGTLGDYTKIARDKMDKSDDRDASCEDSDIDIEWTNINYSSNMGLQIDQGRTSSIAFHPSNPNIYYVGAAWGGLWKTTNGGLTHTLVNDDLPFAGVSGIVIDPENPDRIIVTLSDILYWQSYGIGVYISEDGGENFTPTSLVWDLTENNRIYYIDQDPTNPSHMIIATKDGLFKTTDFFETYELILCCNMRSVKYSRSNPDFVYAGGNDGQFYKSIDGGDSFVLAEDLGSGDVRIAVSLVEGSDRIALTHGTLLQTSEDNGETFETHTLPEGNMVVEFAPMNDDILNIGYIEIYRSDNFGVDFERITDIYGADGLPNVHVDQRNVFVNPLDPDRVYFCNDGGVSGYNVSSNEFDNLSTDLIITQYYDIAVSQSDDYVLSGGAQDNHCVYRSEDGTWAAYGTSGDGTGQEIDPINPNIRYWCAQNGNIIKWIDGETSISHPFGEVGAFHTPYEIDPSNNNRILAGYNYVYVSEDKGDSWEVLGGLASPSFKLNQLAIAPSNPNKIYASRGNVLKVKEPDFDEWISIIVPIGHSITDLQVDPVNEDIVYISVGGFTAGEKVFKSIDSGENWINISGDLPNTPVLSLELYHNETGGIFIGTYGAVYYADDTSIEWKKFGCLPYTGITDIEIQYHTNRIFIGTFGRGMFATDINPDVSSIDEIDISNNLDLTLYPNPVTNSVTIKGQDINFEEFTITLTDATGRIIPTDYTMNANGEIQINCSTLAQGNYFVKLDGNDSNDYILRFSKL